MNHEPIPMSLWACADCGVPSWGTVENHLFDNKLVCVKPSNWKYMYGTPKDKTVCPTRYEKVKGA